MQQQNPTQCLKAFSEVAYEILNTIGAKYPMKEEIQHPQSIVVSFAYFYRFSENLNGLRTRRYRLAQKKLSGKQIYCTIKWFV